MHVLLWGCGNMAGALARGLRAQHPQWRFTCWAPTGTRARPLAEAIGGTFLADASEIPQDVDAVVLGFKPQVLSEAAPGLRKLPAKALVVSLLAAVSVEQLAGHFPARPILRLMPNLAIGRNQGVVLWWGRGLTGDQQQVWKAALATLGLSREAEEDLLDLYTLPAASSPAFLYYWLQGVGEYAQNFGGDPNEAVQLMCQALRAALNDGELKFEQLPVRIAAVASRGGVTQATIDAWKSQSPQYIQDGLSAGLKRLNVLKG
jgi:pyrroline-5-carboxylate reductase